MYCTITQKKVKKCLNALNFFTIHIYIYKYIKYTETIKKKIKKEGIQLLYFNNFFIINLPSCLLDTTFNRVLVQPTNTPYWLYDFK